MSTHHHHPKVTLSFWPATSRLIRCKVYTFQIPREKLNRTRQTYLIFRGLGYTPTEARRAIQRAAESFFKDDSNPYQHHHKENQPS